MEDEKESKEKTLTIGSSKLKLSKPLSMQSMGHNKNKVTVVMKKRVLNRDVQSDKAEDENDDVLMHTDGASFGSLTEKEKIARFNAIKNLNETSKIFESKDLTKEIDEEEEDENEVDEESIEDLLDIEIQDANYEEEVIDSIPEIETEAQMQHRREKLAKTEINIEDDEEYDPLKKKAKIDPKLVKAKVDKARRVTGKITVHSILDEEEEVVKVRSLSSIRRAREKARSKQDQFKQEKVSREIIVPEIITVQELANRMFERVTDVIKELMKMGVIANASHEIDADTAELVVEIFGNKIKRVSEADVEKGLEDYIDDVSTLKRRAPVVTIMGHVDHGKTSLLDALRSTDVVSGEAGGITQHIGAYRIKLESGEYITFIDTPGHEAFTAMRARGAKSTDIVVLVVAADDGIMEQTKEAINHAKAANVPIIVAVNKIDKPEADSQKVRTELLQYNLVPEEFGGDVMVVDVSAKARLNLDKLEETILLQAEMLDLKANPDAVASGVVVESRVDKNQGVLATFLVQRGTLKVGDIVVAGQASGKIKKMYDDKGKVIHSATPSMPVEILGLGASPDAGEKFNIVNTEKQAREVAEYRERNAKKIRVTSVRKGSSIDDLFARTGDHRTIKDLAIIIKGDVQGSIEAIIGSLSKFNNEEVKVKVLHTGVGGITKSDVILADASNALIIGFNVRANSQAESEAAQNNVDIRYYSIIYNLVDDIKAVLSGMLSPIIREEYIGKAIIKQVMNITKAGKIAGCTVVDGVIRQDSNVRLLRDNIVVFEGKLKNLKRFKDDAKEVRNGQECGISLVNCEDIKEKDVIEVFEVIQEQKKL